MKKTGLSGFGVRAVLLVALALGSVNAVATGVPVVDVAAIAQALQQYTAALEQLKQLEDQVATAKSQLTSLQQQATTMQNMYSDFSGISGQAKMFANSVTNWHSYIPSQLSDPAGMVKGELAGPIAALRGAKEKFSAATLFPHASQGDNRELYQEQGDQAFAYRVNAQKAYDGFAERRTSLESLSTAATTASTPKATLDLIAKATAENALLLNDIAQMLALQLGARADEAILTHNRDGVTQSQRLTVNPAETKFK